jgi:hypothetical protein
MDNETISIGTFFTRGLLENIAVTVIVGGPLAVYLAFLVNRLAAFRQIKISVISEIAETKKNTLMMPNYMAAFVYIKWLLEAPTIAMGAEEQWDAMAAIIAVRKEIRAYLPEKLDECMARRNILRRELFNGDDWLLDQHDVYREAAPKIREWVDRIQSLEPDMIRVLGLMPKNRTLNEWERRPLLKYMVPVLDFIRTRKVRWKRFQAYLNGETKDF